MSNLIVLVVLLVIVAWAVKESAKHLHGEGGCCGGGSCEHSAKPEKKKLDGPVLHSYDFEVEGMHCENCAAKVARSKRSAWRRPVKSSRKPSARSCTRTPPRRKTSTSRNSHA